MIRIPHLIAAGIAAFPLVVAAQTANQPGGQASTGTPIDQTTNAPSATPKTTRTVPDVTNPSGSLGPNTAVPAGYSNPSTNVNNTTLPSAMSQKRAKTKATTKTGDVPTYPAPAPDGTPTK